MWQIDCFTTGQAVFIFNILLLDVASCELGPFIFLWMRDVLSCDLWVLPQPFIFELWWGPPLTCRGIRFPGWGPDNKRIGIVTSIFVKTSILIPDLLKAVRGWWLRLPLRLPSVDQGSLIFHPPHVAIRIVYHSQDTDPQCHTERIISLSFIGIRPFWLTWWNWI